MSTPIITLTTDFGARDPWVGIMKGVILGICPAARLVDLSHVIGAQDVLDGALCLEAAVGFFPRGTIHLAVVDPGVGGTRRPMALQTGGQCYVGPDNGLFSLALERDGGRVEAVELTAREYRLSPVSRTFHGRDIFAPAAAHLASGVPLERLGRAMTDPVRLVLPSSRHEDGLGGGLGRPRRAAWSCRRDRRYPGGGSGHRVLGCAAGRCGGRRRLDGATRGIRAGGQRSGGAGAWARRTRRSETSLGVRAGGFRLVRLRRLGLL
jgi:S-adenosyl-l-methionine hydroxide adenosyltransferase